MVRDNHDRSRISRRGFLKSTAGAGALSLLGAGEVVAQRETVEVPIAKRRGEVISTRSVPAKWWDHVQRSRKARRRLQSDLGQTVVNVKTELGKDTISGRRKMKFVVEGHQSEQRPRFPNHVNDLPDQVDDIAVEAREAPDTALTTCDHRQNYNSVEGGYAFGGEDPNGYSNGTAGWRVYYNNKRYVLTAAHLFGCSYSSGQDALQWTQKFGENTNHYDTQLDYALVKKTNSNMVLGNQVYHGGDNYQMIGHAENYEVLMDNNETIYKTGTTSGSTTGTISSVGNSYNVQCVSIGSGDGLEYTNEQASGDSGTAAFILDEHTWGGERAIITGLCSIGRNQIGWVNCGGSQPLYQRTAGVSAEAIQSDMGSSFYFG